MLMDTLVVVLQTLRGLRRCLNPMEEEFVMSIHAMFLQVPLLKLCGVQFLHIIPSAEISARKGKYRSISLSVSTC